MKKIIAVFLTIILIFVAFWLGEAGKGLFQFYPYMIGLIGIVVIFFLVSKKRKYQISCAVLFIIFYASAFYFGDVSFYQAFNGCLEEAKQIRTALSEYRDRNGQYPDVLDDLNRPLPCLRCLRGTILEYEATASNYKLSFKDWPVEHSATAKEPFMAHK